MLCAPEVINKLTLKRASKNDLVAIGITQLATDTLLFMAEECAFPTDHWEKIPSQRQ